MKHEMNANELKDEGNKYFTLHKFDEAIVFYTRAIVCFHCNVLQILDFLL